MDKFINNQAFMAELFDEAEMAERAGEIGSAILEARSLRLTDISVEMEGKSAAGYKQVYMEKMVALLLLVFTIGLLVGEELRDLLYGVPLAEDEPVNDQDRIPGGPTRKKGKKWKRYSGLFVLLKQKWTLTQDQKAAVWLAAFTTFQCLIQPHVRTFV